MDAIWKLRLVAGTLAIPFGVLGAILTVMSLDRVTPAASPVAPAVTGLPSPTELAADRTAAKAEADRLRLMARAAGRLDEVDKPTDLNREAKKFAEALAERRHAILNARELAREGVGEREFRGIKSVDFARLARDERATQVARKALEEFVQTPPKGNEADDIGQYVTQLGERVRAYRGQDAADKQVAAQLELDGYLKAIQTWDQGLTRRFAVVLDDPIRLARQFAELDREAKLFTDLGEQIRTDTENQRNRGVFGSKADASLSTVTRLVENWQARRQVLTVIGSYPEDPTAAEKRFAEAKRVYDQTRDDKFRSALREWVQAYCARFLSEKVLLTDTVQYEFMDTVLAPRREILAVYAKRGDTQTREEIPLTTDPADDQVNEFRYRETAPVGFQFETLRHSGKGDLQANQLKHLPPNLAARSYYLARKKITVWSPAALVQLELDLCDGMIPSGIRKPQSSDSPDADAAYDRTLRATRAILSATLDERPWPGQSQPSRAWTRLQILLAAAKAAPQLFAPNPPSGRLP